MSFLRNNRIVLALAGAIVLLPLVLPGLRDAEFGGTDGQASEAVAATAENFQPWFEPLWKPPSGEIEGLLFALQAALGAGVIGYYFGRRRREGAASKADAGL
ncbi:MAG: energy-coupling factor ABC transporter substrate-binding protein [Rhodospirillales bacterium]|jgi:cobalt/nickel transport protein|nr:energy-coupling factor ABC transporter substrate-binding protein [Rhodospirillales bacterium]